MLLAVSPIVFMWMLRLQLHRLVARSIWYHEASFRVTARATAESVLRDGLGGPAARVHELVGGTPVRLELRFSRYWK